MKQAMELTISCFAEISVLSSTFEKTFGRLHQNFPPNSSDQDKKANRTCKKQITWIVGGKR